MNKEITVLSLVPYKFLPPDMGGQKGIAFFNRYLCKELPLVCVTTKSNSCNREPYEIFCVLGNSKFRYINPSYYFKLRKTIKEHQVTHLILEHPYYGWLGIMLKWFCNIKLVVHSHNIEGLRFKTMNKWWWSILWQYEKIVHAAANQNFFIHNADKDYAIQFFKLDPCRCSTITYGFEHAAIPPDKEKELNRQAICRKHEITPSETILLFNGTLRYQPNLHALDVILQKITPLLLSAPDFRYKIIICGSGLPARYKELAGYKDKNIVYAGFVDDINMYFKGVDLFINPVIDGGGIKTKLVEALGYNCPVISSASGATGLSQEVTGNMLKITPDGDWDAFAEGIINNKNKVKTPDTFFKEFYWGNIAKKAAEIIKINT